MTPCRFRDEEGESPNDDKLREIELDR